VNAELVGSTRSKNTTYYDDGNIAFDRPGRVNDDALRHTGCDSQESTCLALLSQARTFTIEGDRFTFAGAKGTTILLFAKSVLPRIVLSKHNSTGVMYAGSGASHLCVKPAKCIVLRNDIQTIPEGVGQKIHRHEGYY
jgi:hypothetical protein